MSHRKVKFGDAEWDVWDVRPEVRSRSLVSDLQDGWLCFQCGPERRRLTPIPEEWDKLADTELQPLFEQARPVRPAKTPGRATPTDVFRAINRDQERSD